VDKARKGRVVPIGKRAVAALDKYLRAREKRPESHTEALWLGRKGALTPSGLQQLLERLALVLVYPIFIRTCSDAISLISGSVQVEVKRI
jgi:site-specific recombinase XerC